MHHSPAKKKKKKKKKAALLDLDTNDTVPFYLCLDQRKLLLEIYVGPLCCILERKLLIVEIYT
jgi:hypothetical protein